MARAVSDALKQQLLRHRRAELKDSSSIGALQRRMPKIKDAQWMRKCRTSGMKLHRGVEAGSVGVVFIEAGA